MSNKTLYFCDKCGKEQEYGKLTRIGIELDPFTSYKTTRFEKVYKGYDLCDECTEKLGFILRIVVDKQTVVEPTTADKLYDLIAQIVSEEVGDV